MSWARRVLATVEEAAPWVAELAALRPPGIGSAWAGAASIGALRAALPAQAAWALAGVDDPGELWRAEASWWRRVAADATRMARHAHLGMPAVVGSIALLGVDGRRTVAALEVAARAGAPEAQEVFEQVA